MVAGALGVVTALLVYNLLFNFLSPINLSFFADHFNNHSLFNRYEKTFVNNADWLVKQTYNALGNLGHGKHTLAVTFIYPSLYKRVKIHSKSSTRRHQSEALGLIIMSCLLLSGDIHPSSLYWILRRTRLSLRYALWVAGRCCLVMYNKLTSLALVRRVLVAASCPRGVP